jgi:hypothetical protein
MPCTKARCTDVKERWRVELVGDCHAAEDALAGSRRSGRRQTHQVESGEIAGAEDASEDGDAERSPGLVDRLHHP